MSQSPYPPNNNGPQYGYPNYDPYAGRAPPPYGYNGPQQPNQYYGPSYPNQAYQQAPYPYVQGYQNSNINYANNQPHGPTQGRHSSVSVHEQSWGDENYLIEPGKELHGDIDVRIRMGFIRKVYLLLSCQLAVTFGLAATFSFSHTAAVWLYSNIWIFIVAAVASMGIVCAMSCFPKVARTSPTQYICLSVISVCLGFVLGYSTAVSSIPAFAISCGITFAVSIALTLFACQTKVDFTGYAVYAFAFGVVLGVFGIVLIFWRNQIAQLVYACLGALLVSFYLIMDTQQIIGGKHVKYQYGIDDFAFATLSLYLDIVNLFVYILQIVSAASDD